MITKWVHWIYFILNWCRKVGKCYVLTCMFTGFLIMSLLLNMFPDKGKRVRDFRKPSLRIISILLGFNVFIMFNLISHFLTPRHGLAHSWCYFAWKKTWIHWILLSGFPMKLHAESITRICGSSKAWLARSVVVPAISGWLVKGNLSVRSVIFVLR